MPCRAERSCQPRLFVVDGELVSAAARRLRFELPRRRSSLLSLTAQDKKASWVSGIRSGPTKDPNPGRPMLLLLRAPVCRGVGLDRGGGSVFGAWPKERACVLLRIEESEIKRNDATASGHRIKQGMRKPRPNTSAGQPKATTIDRSIKGWRCQSKARDMMRADGGAAGVPFPAFERERADPTHNPQPMTRRSKFSGDRELWRCRRSMVGS